MTLASDIGWKGNLLTVDGISYTGLSVEVVADDQVIQVGSNSVIELSSDSSVANDRTILLENPT